MSQKDPQGIEFPTANQAGMAHYATAVQEMSCFQASVFASAAAAIEVNPTFAMPYFTLAYLNLYMTEPSYRDEARKLMDQLRAAVKPAELSDIEQGHMAAVDSWIDGDLIKASKILDRIGRDHPREILALRVGHEADFFIGATRSLRDRLARQLPSWSAEDPNYGIVLGAYAFGLVENGHYDQAEQFGRRALDCYRFDGWAVHAVAHSFEMRGMVGEGIRFMNDRATDWSENNLFAAHNWWHTALFHLDSEDTAGVLSIYDQGIFNDQSMKVALILLDASSMLWRMHLEGIDTGDRAKAVSSAWKETLPEEPFYVFNDMHAAMAHVVAGDRLAAAGVLRRMDEYLKAGDDGTNNYWNAQRVGRPVVAAVLAYGDQRFNEAVDLLYGVRAHANEFGGSGAQRDVLDRTIFAAASNGGLASFASAIAAEKITNAPNNPSNWRRYMQTLTEQSAPERRIDDARANAQRTLKHARQQVQ